MPLSTPNEVLSVTLEELLALYESNRLVQLSFRQAIDAQYIIAQRLKEGMTGTGKDLYFNLITMQVLVLESLESILKSTIKYVPGRT